MLKKTFISLSKQLSRKVTVTYIFLFENVQNEEIHTNIYN